MSARKTDWAIYAGRKMVGMGVNFHPDLTIRSAPTATAESIMAARDEKLLGKTEKAGRTGR